VFHYDLSHLYEYHLLVLSEMANRSYTVKNGNWYLRTYRGPDLPIGSLYEVGTYVFQSSLKQTIYPEHDNKCLADSIKTLV